MTGGTSPTVFLVAFVVYIAVMIFIGWYSSRGKSEGTDYLTGGRGLNLLMIFGTIGATMIGTGSSMGAISNGFRSGWGGFAACCLVLAVVFGAAKFDLFGYSRYLPQRSRIAAAGLTRNEYQGLYTSQDPAFIDRVLALHTAAVEEKTQQEQRKTDYQRGTDQTQGFYISYRLTDGRLLQRYYSVVYNEADALASGSLISQFSSLYNSPDCVRIRTGFDTPRTEANVLSCYVYSNASDADLELTGAHAWELYAACLADINAGRLGAEDVSGVGTKDDADYTPLYLMFIVTTNRIKVFPFY